MAPLSPPPAAAPLALPAVPAAGARSEGSAPPGPTVQRFPSFGSGSGRSIGALASAASATVASTLGHLRPSPQQAPPTGPPPPYEPPAAAAHTAPPPEYTAVPAGAFDPRELTEFQLDELVHRIIDRVTRLVRTELRMDRERIGRLRDPRA
ncbi:extensin [Streptomyces lavendulae]|uniref:extensin n=1 Tax=Streptomyces lavendulae TaxID=1914 RepID=UPI00340152F9